MLTRPFDASRAPWEKKKTAQRITKPYSEPIQTVLGNNRNHTKSVLRQDMFPFFDRGAHKKMSLKIGAFLFSNRTRNRTRTAADHNLSVATPADPRGDCLLICWLVLGVERFSEKCRWNIFKRQEDEGRRTFRTRCGSLFEPSFRKILVSVNFCPQFWGRKWVRRFYGRLGNAFFLQEKRIFP